MPPPKSEPSNDAPAQPPEKAGEPAPPTPADELAAAKREAADYYDRYLRAVADLENFRRRTIREREELRLFGTAGVLGDLIPVLDSLSLAVESAKQPHSDLKALADGVDRVLQQFKAALAAQGFIEINPVGLPFDPHQHEAISHQPDARVKEEHIITVVRTGYSLNGRLLRPASVIVSSGPGAKK
jgi:molecular chaperone GrpE